MSNNKFNNTLVIFAIFFISSETKTDIAKPKMILSCLFRFIAFYHLSRCNKLMPYFVTHRQSM